MAAIVVLVAAWALGTWLLWPFYGRQTFEGRIFRLLVGLCACALLIICVGSVSLPAAQVTLFAVAFLGLAYELFALSHRHDRARTGEEQSTPRPRPLSLLERICVAVLVVAFALALLSALAPPTSWDAAVAHLALPSDYTREGRIMAFEGNAYSAYPHLLHSLYTAAFSQGGERAVTLLNWCLAGLACATVYLLGKRIESRRCGLIAAAILATAPIFFDQAGLASIDLPFVGLATGALLAFAAWRQEGRRSFLFISAFLAGASSGARHTGFIICLLLGIGVLLGGSGRRARSAAAFGGLALLAAAPWMLRSALVAGNPFYPFFASIFAPDRIPDAQAASFGTHPSIHGLGLREYLMFPWNIVMRPHWYDGWAKSPGGLVLFLGVPGLFVGGRNAWRLAAYSIAGGTFFFFFQQSARYLLPFFVPAMVVAAMAACRLRSLLKPIAVLLVISFGYGLLLGIATVHFKAPAALGLVNREAYLKDRVERYPAFAWANANLESDKTILTLDIRSYYIEGRTYQNFEALVRLVNRPFEDQLEWLKARHIHYMLYPNAYVAEAPYYEETGLAGMLETWRRDRTHFKAIHRMRIRNPRSGAMEQVEFYALHYDDVRT